MPRELGLSALFVLTGERNAVIVYVSESMSEILGYEPQDLVGKTSYVIFHPDEIPLLKEVHYHALTNEKVGCIMYMRLLHQRGFFVDCAVTYSTVYDLTVGIVTRAINGPNHIRLAATAREVIEVRGGAEGIRMKRWSMSSGSRSPTSSPVPMDKTRPWDQDWVRPALLPRTFFLIDRFTESARIMFVSNDVIVNGSAAKEHSFYCLVRPSDRPRVRQWIEAAKNCSPIVYDDERTGGHGYLSFMVLKVPDLPPPGTPFPTGTNDSVTALPGQSLIPVEGIFTASSDGIACVIGPMPTSPALDPDDGPTTHPSAESSGSGLAQYDASRERLYDRYREDDGDDGDVPPRPLDSVEEDG